MTNARLWHLSHQTRHVANTQAQSGGLWNDGASRHIHGRYLRPHQGEADELLRGLEGQQQHLEEVAGSVRDTQVHYDEARVAGEDVVAEIGRAEYAVSMTHDSIQRALTFESRAAQMQDQMVALAESANAVCDGCAGEKGQLRSSVTYTPIERSAFATFGGRKGGISHRGVGAAKDAIKMAAAAMQRWSPQDQQRFKSWFGARDEGARNIVFDRIRLVNGILDLIQIEEWPSAKANEYAQVLPEDPTHTIQVGPLFHSAPLTGPDSQAGIILHEASHFLDAGGTVDVPISDTEAVYGPRLSHRLAEASPGLALQNADNFEYFVEQFMSLMQGPGDGV